MQEKQKPSGQEASSFWNFRNISSAILMILIVLAIPIPYKGDFTPVYQILVGQFMGESSKMPANADWLLEVDVDHVLQPNGLWIDYDEDYDIGIAIERDGHLISGEYLSSTSSACGQAVINGQVKDDAITWVVTYSGSCCGGAQMQFVGTLSDDGESFSGSFEPLGNPPDGCWTWWADVSASVQD